MPVTKTNMNVVMIIHTTPWAVLLMRLRGRGVVVVLTRHMCAEFALPSSVEIYCLGSKWSSRATVVCNAGVICEERQPWPRSRQNGLFCAITHFA